MKTQRESPGKSPGKSQPRQRGLQQSGSPLKIYNASDKYKKDLEDIDEDVENQRALEHQMQIANQLSDRLRLPYTDTKNKHNEGRSPHHTSSKSVSNKSFKDFLMKNQGLRKQNQQVAHHAGPMNLEEKGYPLPNMQSKDEDYDTNISRRMSAGTLPPEIY